MVTTALQCAEHVKQFGFSNKRLHKSSRQICGFLSSVQFISVQSLQQVSEEKSVKGQPEKISLEPRLKLTATDGRERR